MLCKYYGEPDSWNWVSLPNFHIPFHAGFIFQSYEYFTDELMIDPRLMINGSYGSPLTKTCMFALYLHIYLLSLKIWKYMKWENQSPMNVYSIEYFFKIFICFVKISIFLVIDYYILEFLSSYYALNFLFCYKHLYIFVTHTTLLESNSTSLISISPTT